MKLHQKGFTLTELLVVVVVIGILAAVALPKFNKVLDTYKTAEAEHMLEAVRNEQEAREEIDNGGGYTTDGSVLGAFPGDESTFSSKHFTYTLGNGSMTAASRNSSLSYTLKIDYASGAICCSGEDCVQLNKDYTACSGL